MSGVGIIFQANLNADKIFIDRKYLPSTILHRFWLTISNQSTVTLYFRIFCNISNWSMNSPSDGRLGSVGVGATGTFTPILQRSAPTSDTTDTGNLKIEAYTDSGYSTKVGEQTLDVTVNIEDTESFTDVTIYNFNDGTAQGWTLGSYVTISSDLSVEAGGYSAKFYRADYAGDTEAYIERSITVPNRSKARLSFFWAYRLQGDGTMQVKNLAVLVGGAKVYDIPFVIESGTGDFTRGWYKVTVDLSAYKGQTVTVRLRAVAYSSTHTGSPRASIWFDRVVIAGKD